MASKKPRVDTNPAQAGLNQAFANLELANVSPDPEKKEDAVIPSPAGRKLGRVVLRKETAHRAGKPVIVVYDFESHVSAAQIEEFARKLRTACGCGGTVKGRTIEIQGNQPARVREVLQAEGFRVAGVL
jgi:translation initiation factor 1